MTHHASAQPVGSVRRIPRRLPGNAASLALVSFAIIHWVRCIRHGDVQGPPPLRRTPPLHPLGTGSGADAAAAAAEVIPPAGEQIEDLALFAPVVSVPSTEPHPGRPPSEPRDEEVFTDGVSEADQYAPTTETTRRVSMWLPVLSLVAALGLAAIVVADTLARSGRARPDALYWFGLLLIVVPISMRLLVRNVARTERIGLVLVASLELYLVKVAWSPVTFTLGDEFIHWLNVEHILTSHRLFTDNSLLPVTSKYPALESATAELSAVSGLSAFHAGLVVVGIAKLTFVLSLFLLFEQIVGSSRIAGIGTLLYTANGNFLIFDSQFKYESLALPFVALAILGAVRWQRTRGAERTVWGSVAVIAITCAIMTHHVSSYLLLLYLIAATIVHLALRKPLGRSPLPFALFAGGATIAWLLFVATETRQYVDDIFTRALTGLAQSVTTAHGRAPLSTTTAGVASPLWEHVAAVAFAALITLALPFAIWQVWKGYRRATHMLLFTAAAVAYIGSLGLRLSPASWETGNRAGAFLFAGTALTLALASVMLAQRLNFSNSAYAVFALGAVVIFVGSNIGGQPRDARLPLPLRIETREGFVLEPEGYVVADWAARNLGPGAQIVADESNRRLLAVAGASAFDYGHGRVWGAKYLLLNGTLSDLSYDIGRKYGIRYVLADRRKRSWDNIRGYYFNENRLTKNDLFPPSYKSKFQRLPGVQRLVDTGNIALFDVGGWRAPQR
jgi:hypothetical protein